MMGHTVLAGPWAGWIVVRARRVVKQIGMLPTGRAGTVLYHGPPKYVCAMEHPTTGQRTGTHFVLEPRQVKPPRQRVRIAP